LKKYETITRAPPITTNTGAIEGVLRVSRSITDLSSGAAQRSRGT